MAENSQNPIPFSEPPYLRGLPSPYYNASHLEFQKKCRAFLWEHLTQHALEWDKEGTVPEHVFDTFAKANMLVPNMPAPLPVDWLKKLGLHDILGVKVEDWDYMHTGIYIDEVSRRGAHRHLFLFISGHVSLTDTMPGGSIWLGGTGRLHGGRLFFWNPTHRQIRQSGAASSLPARLADGEEAHLHCCHRA